MKRTNKQIKLSLEYAHSTDFLDLFFGFSGEKLGLDDDGLFGKNSFAQNLVEALES